MENLNGIFSLYEHHQSVISASEVQVKKIIKFFREAKQWVSMHFYNNPIFDVLFNGQINDIPVLNIPLLYHAFFTFSHKHHASRVQTGTDLFQDIILGL